MDSNEKKDRKTVMENPTLFASSLGIERHICRDLAEEFAEELDKMSGRCIDVGSGPGCAVVKFILPKLDPKSTLVCSDISESMLDFAKTTYGGDARLSFVKLDIATRNLPDDLVGQFDHVTSFYCLHWFDGAQLLSAKHLGRGIRANKYLLLYRALLTKCNEPCPGMPNKGTVIPRLQAFENMFSLLRPGGTLLLNFMSNNPIFDAWDDLAAMPRYQPYMKDRSIFASELRYDKRPAETLRKMIKNVGFDIGHLSERKVDNFFNNQETLKDLLESVNPFMNRMPADLRKEHREDLFKALVNRDDVFQKYNSKNEHITLFGWHTLVVYLKKPESS